MTTATGLLHEQLTPVGLELPLEALEQAFYDSVRRFAREFVRPAGRQLDRMSAEQVIAAGSPYWQVLLEFSKLGISAAMLAGLEPCKAAKITHLLLEELGWADAGLAVSIGAAFTPKRLAQLFGNRFLLDNIPDAAIGCWAITEPDHGSDFLDDDGRLMHPGTAARRPNCVATIRDGEIVIQGQKSAWVSNGTVAQYAALFCACDRGRGELERAALVVPLDASGVTRGKPLEKLGQRSLPQGEIYFDQVSISTDWLIAPVEDYRKVARVQLTDANGGMGMYFCGVARAAFEHALDYAHERRQGGVPIVLHQNVRSRLLHMFRRVEAARALARRNAEYNAVTGHAALIGAICAKLTSTQTAFDVASDALQIFGSNGLTPEYPIEKLLRDARSSLIEDGCNEVLAIKGGGELMQDELLRK